MTSTIQAAPIAVSSSDRFSLTVFFALAMHAIIILGVSFNLVDQDNQDDLSTMEITLVHNRAEEAPEDADYLAQANQLGGGNVEEKVRDSSPFSNTTPTQEQGIAPASVRALAPQTRRNARKSVNPSMNLCRSRRRRSAPPSYSNVVRKLRGLAPKLKRSKRVMRLPRARPMSVVPTPANFDSPVTWMPGAPRWNG
jgi:protein TonB